MMRALWTAGSGMMAQQMNIDIISNNLANVNTTGFKKSRVDFEDLLYQTEKTPGSAASQGSTIPTGLQVGHGTKSVSTTKIFTQGDFTNTGNPMDLVIEGDGFFQVQMPDGSTAYTRDGAFKVDGGGRIVNSEGDLLQPQLTVPTDSTGITIGNDGTVSVTMADGTNQQIGQIELARFINPSGLLNIGGNMMKATAASGDPATGTAGTNGIGPIEQGYLEMSNVKVIEEMVNMIVAQRAYEVNSKAIQASDEMLQTANNLKR